MLLWLHHFSLRGSPTLSAAELKECRGATLSQPYLPPHCLHLLEDLIPSPPSTSVGERLMSMSAPRHSPGDFSIEFESGCSASTHICTRPSPRNCSQNPRRHGISPLSCSRHSYRTVPYSFRSVFQRRYLSPAAVGLSAGDHFPNLP